MRQLESQLDSRISRRRASSRPLSEAQQERARLGAELDAERKAGTASSHCWRMPSKTPGGILDAFIRTLRQTTTLPRACPNITLRVPHSAQADLEGRQKAIADLVQPLKISLTEVDAKLQQVEHTG